MKTVITLFFTSLLSAGLVSTNAQASVTGESSTVITSCEAARLDNNGSQAAACQTYVTGFIEGATLFDQLYINHLRSVHKEDATAFFQRAYQTRVGAIAVTSRGEQQALFCLDANSPQTDIVGAVIGSLFEPLSSIDVLNGQILAYLEANFPCE